MGNRSNKVIPDVSSHSGHSFLMATGVEICALARKGQQKLPEAGGAFEPGKAVTGDAAAEVTCHRGRDDSAVGDIEDLITFPVEG